MKKSKSIIILAILLSFNFAKPINWSKLGNAIPMGIGYGLFSGIAANFLIHGDKVYKTAEEIAQYNRIWKNTILPVTVLMTILMTLKEYKS